MVDRSLGVVVIRLVAGYASSASQIVVALMTLVAGHRRRRVAPGQQKACQGVIELRIQPVVGGVATFAGPRKRRYPGVFRIRRASKISLVARNADGRHRLELAVGCVLVAGIAIHRRVRAGQRKAVVVILHALDGHVPAADRMALFAVRAQLVLVDVRVAVRALVADVGEHRLDVAGNARHTHVPAAQRVFGLVVIEFRNSANWLPALGRVAVRAGNVQGTVRALRFCNAGFLRPERGGHQQQREAYSGKFFKHHS